MAKKICMITGAAFDHPDKNIQVDPFLVQNLMYAMANDETSRKTFFQTLAKDQKCMNVITEAMLTTNCEEVGISVPGTLAEFFLSHWDESASS